MNPHHERTHATPASSPGPEVIMMGVVLPGPVSLSPQTLEPELLSKALEGH